MNYFRLYCESLQSIKDIHTKYIDNLEKFNVYEFGNKISIDLIVVKTKNEGIGTKVIQDICDYADFKNKTIILTPSGDFGGSVSRLKKFYKRFGFVENSGKNKDFEIFEKMYRIPKTNLKEHND